MWLTAEQRRKMLNLFNVSEAARSIGISIGNLHYHIRTGRLPQPQVRFGNRLYFTSDDLKILEEKWDEMQNRP